MSRVYFPHFFSLLYLLLATLVVKIAIVCGVATSGLVFTQCALALPAFFVLVKKGLTILRDPRPQVRGGKYASLLFWLIIPLYACSKVEPLAGYLGSTSNLLALLVVVGYLVMIIYYLGFSTLFVLVPTVFIHGVVFHHLIVKRLECQYPVIIILLGLSGSALISLIDWLTSPNKEFRIKIKFG